MPAFRRFSDSGQRNAFIEGWGLYAESLGDELGMYGDPYQRLGSLSADAWRCSRLVVDTGMHAKGWSREESQPLLDYLYAQVRQNEWTCRFSWQPGSIAIWDNRATQHCALNDYHGERRLMHRITIDGEDLQAYAAN